MVTLTCKRCGNTWEYRGKSKWYAPCSHCRTSINIQKNIELNRLEQERLNILSKKRKVKQNRQSAIPENKLKAMREKIGEQISHA